MDGFLLIDKPAGMTSHDVVDRVRRVIKTRRVGHAGTLDPFATGLLIVGVGKATKELGKLAGLGKTYEAVLHLGATSDTFDKEGIIRPSPLQSPLPKPDGIEQALMRFRGGYEQRAPLFSAKKIRGKKLYELARKGLATESMRPVKFVEIFELRMDKFAFPMLTLHVSCSSGTYIRSLADDIGCVLGVGAYLEGLRRTRIGTHCVENAVTLDNLSDKMLSWTCQP